MVKQALRRAAEPAAASLRAAAAVPHPSPRGPAQPSPPPPSSTLAQAHMVAMPSAGDARASQPPPQGAARPWRSARARKAPGIQRKSLTMVRSRA